jgi:hypothetical protein
MLCCPCLLPSVKNYDIPDGVVVRHAGALYQYSVRRFFRMKVEGSTDPCQTDKPQLSNRFVLKVNYR